MSARFYCPNLAPNGMLHLGADESKHVSRVCRLGVGDSVELFDGKGFATRAHILKIGNYGVELTAVGPPILERPTPFSLTLASAVPKGDRFDWLVEKATELGVERFIPIITERSVVEPGGPKLERLRRVIIEASKQCRRNRLMILESPGRWEHVARQRTDSIRFLADPSGAPPSHWPALTLGRPVILAVGPEGGFTPPERRDADSAGWLAISLGTHTLRIETAGIAGSAALFSHVSERNP